MNKKVVVLGGGTGLSTLLRGLKEFPVSITAVVSVCDDGRSTGRLREEFHTIAVGDLRRVLISLSETEPLVEKLFDYRFQTTSDLNGHTVGNILLTALSNITDSMSEGIEAVGNVLKLKGKVLPLTEDSVTLMGKMEDGSIVEGEHNITESKLKISSVFYKEPVKVVSDVIRAIEEADLVVLSMGSLFTSIIPNLICEEVQQALERSSAKIMYICNMMTQPGETDYFKASDHVKLLNQYLKNRHVDFMVVNRGQISSDIIEKYASLEQKDLVNIDYEELKKLGVSLIENNYVSLEDGIIRHNSLQLGFDIFSYFVSNKEG